MSLVSQDLWVAIPPETWPASSVGAQQSTLNATAEAVHYVGQVQLEGGSVGGSKTISSAGGGKIHWLTGSTIAFSDAGSTLRVGLQDVSTAAGPPGRGDGTFDVSADLVGGTDTIVTTTTYETPMETGTKTLAHGDMAAIVFDLVSRGGSDIITVKRWSNRADTTMGYPISVLDTGTPQLQSGQPCAVIEFDDGTLGWLFFTYMRSSVGTIAFKLDTAVADEYGTYIDLITPIRVIGITATIDVSSGADFEVIIYSDPLGTPAAEETLVVDVTQTGTTSMGSCVFLFANEVVLPAGGFVVAIRPTTTALVTLTSTDVANVDHFKTFGALAADKCYAVRRLDNTGAFSDYNNGTANTRRLQLSVIADQLHRPVGRASTHIGI